MLTFIKNSILSLYNVEGQPLWLVVLKSPLLVILSPIGIPVMAHHVNCLNRHR